jgi:hypothetical protein
MTLKFFLGILEAGVWMVASWIFVIFFLGILEVGVWMVASWIFVMAWHGLLALFEVAFGMIKTIQEQ